MINSKSNIVIRKAEKYKNVAFVAILFFGTCLFSACSKDEDEKLFGIDTTIAAVFTNARLSVADLQKVANIMVNCRFFM